LLSRLLKFCLALIILVFLGQTTQASQATLKSASELDYPPFSIVSSDGTADGFSVDLLKAALAEMNREVEFKVNEWNKIKSDLEHGRLDILPLVGRTPERESIFDFTVPYLTLYGAVFVNETTHEINKLDDLYGLTVGVLSGDNAEEFLYREKITESIVSTTTFEKAFIQLGKGQVDAVLAQRIVGLNLINKLGLENVKTAIAPVTQFRQDFAFAVTEGNSELLAILNEGLSIIRTNGEYDRIHKKWLSSLTQKSEQQIKQSRILMWLAMFIAVSILLILLFVMWKNYLRTKEDEIKFRDLFENMAQGGFYQSADGKLTSVNQAALDIFGMTQEQFLGTTSSNHLFKVIREDGTAFPAADHPSMVALMTGKPIKGIIAGIYNANREIFIWVDINAIPQFHYNQSKPYQVFVTLHDITRIRSMEQRYHALFEQAATGIARVAPDGKWLEVNHKLCEIVGYNKDELLHLTFQDITHADDLQADLEYVKQMLEGEIQTYSMEKRYIHKKGNIVWINLTVSLIRKLDGSPKFFISVIEDIQQRKQIELNFKVSQMRYQTLVESSPLGFYETDRFGKCIYVNNTWQDMTGLTLQQSLGDGWQQSLHKDDRDKVGELWQQFIAGKTSWKYEYRMCKHDGKINWVLGTAVPIRDINGQISGYLGANLDITERKKNENKLKLASSVYTNAREGICITDHNNHFIDVNSSFTEITGYTLNDVKGKDPKLLSSGKYDKAFFKQMWKKLEKSGHWYGEIQNRRKNGEIYTESITITTIRGTDGKIDNYLGIFSDVTDRIANLKKLENIAHYDSLTKLPNRLLLSDRIKQSISNSKRNKKLVAVVYLDLDGFKQVNDIHGHEMGDRLLVQLARNMKEALREGDTLARIGGDEFVVILGDLEDTHFCIPLLERLLEESSRPIHIGELTLQVSASLGVTFLSKNSNDADLLLRQADQAMYQAKLSGKNRYHIFDTESDLSLRGRYEYLEDIRQALQNNQFELYYQPKVNMRTGKLIGTEALLRWKKDNKLLLPGSFLPAIKDQPLEIDLDKWVINEALLQNKRWLQKGLDIRISVNISANFLQQPDFMPHLERLLQAHPEVPPCNLDIEVLETSALTDITRSAQLMQDCKELGISFSLDDFGTGYSSLSYLKRLPVEYLKIDRSFVKDMLIDTDDLAILEGIMGMANAFQMKALAEGVESIEHGKLLLYLGCESAQGFIIAKPMQAQDFPGWLESWQPNISWFGQVKLPYEMRPLLIAGIEHQNWVRLVNNHLTGYEQKGLKLNEHKCRFGIWLNSDGYRDYKNEPSFEELVTIHSKLHKQASQLINAQQQGEDISVRQEEFDNLSEQLGKKLEILLKSIIDV